MCYFFYKSISFFLLSFLKISYRIIQSVEGNDFWPGNKKVAGFQSLFTRDIHDKWEIHICKCGVISNPDLDGLKNQSLIPYPESQPES